MEWRDKQRETKTSDLYTRNDEMSGGDCMYMKVEWLVGVCGCGRAGGNQMELHGMRRMNLDGWIGWMDGCGEEVGRFIARVLVV